MTPDVKLAELTLEGIRTIREYAGTSDPQSILNIACVKIIKLLMSTINVDGGSLYYVSRDGECVKSYSYGVDASYSATYFQSPQLNSCDSRHIVLPIPIRSRKSYLSQAVLGYMTLFREEPFSFHEDQLVREIIQFLAHFGQYGLELQVEAAAEALYHKIDAVLQNEQRPGSVVGNLLMAVHRGLQPRASYFGILTDSKICVDYLYHRRFHTSRQVSFRRIPKEILERISRSGSFLLSDRPETVYMRDLLAPYTAPSIDESIYVASVYAAGREPIGLVLVEFSRSRYFDEDKVKSVLAYRKEEISKWVGYLYQRRTGNMIANPIFRSRDTRIDEAKAFVLMPFGEPWSGRIWTRLIRPTVEGEGLSAIRADDLYGRDIMEDIWQSILRSRLVIADITGRNANVFYELGIAHAIGKPVILMTQNVADIPFDLNRFRHIIYEDNLDGYDRLTRDLQASIREILRVEPAAP